MTQRQSGQQPRHHDPNEPYRNPNLIQPGHDPQEIDQRPKPPRRASSLWLWVLVGAVALIALISLLTLGTTEVGQTPTVTLPQGETPIDAQ